MQVIEILGKENVQINPKQVKQIIDLIGTKYLSALINFPCLPLFHLTNVTYHIFKAFLGVEISFKNCKRLLIVESPLHLLLLLLLYSRVFCLVFNINIVPWC